MKSKLFAAAVFLFLSFSVLPFFGALANAGQLDFSTFLGGNQVDKAYAIAVDTAGNVYVTGYTLSLNFPTTVGGYDTTVNNIEDVFVTKLNSNGSTLLYSTYIGGSGSEYEYGIEVDNTGCAYIAGYTSSNDFPTTLGALDFTFNGINDVFVTKLNAAGSDLIYSTFLGGGGQDECYCIVVDSGGNAYIAGITSSSDFPTTIGAYDRTPGINFLSKINPSGSLLIYSTYFHGQWPYSYIRDIAIDSVGNAYITGETGVIPTTFGAFDTTANGGLDSFVTKFNANGSALVYSTYLGGNSNDIGYSIAVDSAGNAYITGKTSSFNFPITPGALDTVYSGGTTDIFVTKLNAAGSALLYSTLLGGADEDVGNSIALDNEGNVCVTGYTRSSDFPATVNSFDRILNGIADAIVSRLNADGTMLLYSTYLGGSGEDYGSGIALDNTGSAIITGVAGFSDFPVTTNAYDTSYNGDLSDAFVSKVSFYPTVGKVFYSDINQNSSVDAGDKLTMQFDQRMRVNSATASDFYLPVVGDSLGSGAIVSINTVNDTQLVITLGTLPTLTIPGIFSLTTAGSPSGIDISATMTPDAIENLYGVDAQDGGVPGINDSGMDILYTVSPDSAFVSAFSAATVQVSQDTINAYYTKHKVVIPTNSLLTSATITAGPPGENRGQLSAVSFSPPDVTFNADTPATIVIEYKDADTKQELGYMENAMRIHQWDFNSNQWILVPETLGPQSVNTSNRTVSVPINKFDMVGSGSGFMKSFFAANTMIVYVNIDLPTVGATTTTVASSKGLLSSATTVISIGTTGIYTKHKLTLTDYTTASSGVTVALLQATFEEKHYWQNYAILKIATFGTITTPAILTMEYKDHDDANNQFKNDIIGGAEYQMRIYHWRDDLGQWEIVPGLQVVNNIDNTVRATIDTLSAIQIYAVKVDPTANPVLVDYPWEFYN